LHIDKHMSENTNDSDLRPCLVIIKVKSSNFTIWIIDIIWNTKYTYERRERSVNSFNSINFSINLQSKILNLV